LLGGGEGGGGRAEWPEEKGREHADQFQRQALPATLSIRYMAAAGPEIDASSVLSERV